MPSIQLHQTWHTTPHQSSTDALHTVTPNLADLPADLTPSIEHRCLAYRYTKDLRKRPFTREGNYLVTLRLAWQ